MAFRVSVVGHRPNRLPKAAGELAVLRGRLRAVLAAVKEAVAAFRAEDPDAALYSAEPAILRAISPLAEGADRMFAEEALALGYSLCCPMPFAQEAFEEDFIAPAAMEPDSLARFRALLERARRGAGLTVFELDGEHASEEARSAAYAAAGRVVLNQSDLMVVVWDGGESAGPGGTVDTLHEAIGFHVPVLWIDAAAPFGWMLVRSRADIALPAAAPHRRPAGAPSADEEEESRKIARVVGALVREEIGLPAVGQAVEARSAPQKAQPLPREPVRVHATDFFAERRPALNPFVVWKIFRDLIGDARLTLPRVRTGDFLAAIRRSWPASDEDVAGRASEGGGPKTIHWVNRETREHFGWSDRLADLYADAYRSAFLMSYLLAAAAVLIALLPGAAGWVGANPAVEIACIVAEFTMLCLIVGLLVVGRSRRWHERWMEYRVLAELIRELKVLIPLGGGRPLPRTPTHLAVYGDPAQTWMYWHLRAIARAAGIPDARASPDYLRQCLQSLIDVADHPADGQRRFHEVNARRFEHLYERLHRAAFWLFLLTIVAISLHLSPRLFARSLASFGRWVEANREWLVLASALLPALGAALTSINNHGEFIRIAKRSRAMADGFARFADDIRRLRRALDAGERVTLAQVTPLASKIAETMVDEVIDWRVVVLDRPQTAA